MQRFEWLIYVGLAGLCWGTYVPLIAFGGKELKSRYGAFLCVGVAYFLVAILIPVGRFMLDYEKWPDFSAKMSGTAFATLAGVAGALGALCVIFANATASKPEDRIYIAPLIFALAPVINTVVSLFWHPTSDLPASFGWPHRSPGWELYIGILLVAIGAGLVLYSKESGETPGKPTPQPTPAVAGGSG